MIDFTTLSGLGSGDYIVVVQSGGAGGKLQKSVFVSLINSECKPSIKDGTWWVGGEDLEIEAEGKTAEFQKSDLGIEWKYTSESTWKLLVAFDDIRLRFQDLTDEQKAEITPSLEDMTDAFLEHLTEEANQRLANADKAVEEANSAVEKAGKAVDNANAAATTAKTAASTANSAAQTATTAASNANSAANSAKMQSDRAKNYADHPSKIGDNGNWYVWSESKNAYVDTGTSASGDMLFPAFDVTDDMHLTVEYSKEERFELNTNGHLILN